MSSRQRFREHYLAKSPAQLLKAAAAASAGPLFTGPSVEISVVIRADLNGYSSWVRNRTVADRVSLLDNFFGHCMEAMGRIGGIYYRDEGDCVVAIVSPYFGIDPPFPTALALCKAIVAGRFGPDSLSAKCIVGCGPVLFFQKAHEQGTVDWSAEGDPFVEPARVEVSVDSKPQITFFESDWSNYFSGVGPVAAPGTVYHWETEKVSKQVIGLGLLGGWASLVQLTHIPQGRVQV